MNLTRIQKQLAKDIRKSPAKAAALAALTLVALYAWAPLLFRAGSASETIKASGAASQPVAAEQAAPPAATAPTTGLPVHWATLASWMDTDPRMRPATLHVSTLRPFSRDAVVSDEPDEQPAAVSESVASLDPQSLGLKVSSTMLGKQRRVAVINGRPYPEGRQLQVSNELAFTVVEVGLRHVVLESAGQRFELPVAESGSELQ
jgi:hypothetical protein